MVIGLAQKPLTWSQDDMPKPAPTMLTRLLWSWQGAGVGGVVAGKSHIASQVTGQTSPSTSDNFTPAAAAFITSSFACNVAGTASPRSWSMSAVGMVIGLAQKPLTWSQDDMPKPAPTMLTRLLWSWQGAGAEGVTLCVYPKSHCALQVVGQTSAVTRSIVNRFCAASSCALLVKCAIMSSSTLGTCCLSEITAIAAAAVVGQGSVTAQK